MKKAFTIMTLVFLVAGCSNDLKDDFVNYDGVYTCTLASNEYEFKDFSVFIDGNQFTESANLISKIDQSYQIKHNMVFDFLNVEGNLFELKMNGKEINQFKIIDGAFMISDSFGTKSCKK